MSNSVKNISYHRRLHILTRPRVCCWLFVVCGAISFTIPIVSLCSRAYSRFTTLDSRPSIGACGYAEQSRMNGRNSANHSRHTWLCSVVTNTSVPCLVIRIPHTHLIDFALEPVTYSSCSSRCLCEVSLSVVSNISRRRISQSQ